MEFTLDPGLKETPNTMDMTPYQLAIAVENKTEFTDAGYMILAWKLAEFESKTSEYDYIHFDKACPCCSNVTNVTNFTSIVACQNKDVSAVRSSIPHGKHMI